MSVRLMPSELRVSFRQEPIPLQLPCLRADVLGNIGADLTRHAHHPLGQAASGDGLLQLTGLPPNIGDKNRLQQCKASRSSSLIWSSSLTWLT